MATALLADEGYAGDRDIGDSAAGLLRGGTGALLVAQLVGCFVLAAWSLAMSVAYFLLFQPLFGSDPERRCGRLSYQCQTTVALRAKLLC